MVDLDRKRKFCQFMVSSNPGDHFHTLGIRFTHVEQGKVRAELAYSDDIIGDPKTGIIHGGTITALLDTSCGFAAMASLDHIAVCPTIDLRVDYMKPAQPRKPVYAEAEAYKITRHVIFCRSVAYQDDINNPIAYCVGNFSRMAPEVAAQMAKQIDPLLDIME